MALPERPRRAWLPFQQVRRSLRRISGIRAREEKGTQAQNAHSDVREPNHEPDMGLRNEMETVAEENTSATPKMPIDRTANPQAASAFFSKLPPEIRRMIYAQVWRAHLGAGMRVHLHSSSNEQRMQHTACIVDAAAAPSEEDPSAIAPFPGHIPQRIGGPESPDWFWWAWCLRMRWGRHWACQARVMARWAEHGVWDRVGWSPFLPVFLTCRKMYAEAVQCFFETATLCFTGSEDAHQFLVRSPHPYQHNIRSLDFNFSHHKDHLFLISIEAKHPRLMRNSGVGVGMDAWDALMSAVRESIPDLRSLHLLINNRLPAPEDQFWNVFALWQPHYMMLELPPIRKKYEIRHGRASSVSGPLPSALRQLNSPDPVPAETTAAA